MGYLDRRRERMAKLVAQQMALLAEADEAKAGTRVSAGAVMTDAGPMLAAIQASAGSSMSSRGGSLSRDMPVTAFGPGVPVPPFFIDPRLPSGRPAPRRSEFPVSWNLPGQGQPPVDFPTLRAFADQVDIARRCIEVRKNEIVSLDWDIVLRSEAVESVINDTGEKNQARASRIARDLYSDHIDRLKSWWEEPDRINGFGMSDWLSLILEEHLVLDALSIFPHLKMNGELHSLEILDGATIKPLLDFRGAVPAPPNPAYQQILHGFPRGEFVASFEADHDFDADSLIYKPRYRRTFNPYGYSNTEQALVTGELYLKRQAWMRGEFSEGVTPEMIVETDADLTPDQLKFYQSVFNDALSGQSDERHRAWFLPRGFKPTTLSNFAERYSANYDEFLIKLIAAEYDVMPMELGFHPHGGLGGAGFAQGAENSTYRKSIRPTLAWVIGIINSISHRWLDMPRELTFKFIGLEVEDELVVAQTRDLQVKAGVRTINDVRAEIGLPLFDFPEADMPFVIGREGVQFLEGLSLVIPLQMQPGGPIPTQRALNSDGEPTGPQPDPGPSPMDQALDIAETVRRGEPLPGEKDPTAQVVTTVIRAKEDDEVNEPPQVEVAARLAAQKAVEDEMRAFVAFAGKRVTTGKWRDFKFGTVSADTARLLNALGSHDDIDGAKVVIAGMLKAAETDDVPVPEVMFDNAEPGSLRARLNDMQVGERYTVHALAGSVPGTFRGHSPVSDANIVASLVMEKAGGSLAVVPLSSVVGLRKHAA